MLLNIRFDIQRIWEYIHSEEFFCFSVWPSMGYEVFVAITDELFFCYYIMQGGMPYCHCFGGCRLPT